MKKIVCILSAQLVALFSFSQEITVGNTEMDILFVGYSNKLVLSVSDTELSDIKIEGENCKISEIDKTGVFTVVPSGSGSLTLNFSVKGKAVGSKKYRVKGFPKPDLYLGNNEPGSPISKKNLSSKLSMNYHPDATFPIQFSLPTIINWSVTTEKGEAIGTGSILSKEALVLLQSATENQEVTIIANVISEDKIQRKTASSFVITE
jgi:hypothetical protein